MNMLDALTSLEKGLDKSVVEINRQTDYSSMILGFFNCSLLQINQVILEFRTGQARQTHAFSPHTVILGESLSPVAL